jgi:2-haloacid dehalogenase
VVRAIVFDVNGTLLDTHALAPVIRGIFGSRYSVDQWFEQFIGYTMATTLSGDYRDFGDIAVSVLEMAASARDLDITAQQKMKVRNRMKQLPAFREVKRALRHLQDGNFRLAALSNSSTASLETQLQHAGIWELFEQRVSVELVRRYKPAPDPYHAAAQLLGVDVREMLMVAAHPWDLMGAARSGCVTAFIRRPGKALLPGAPEPDFVAADLTDLAGQLLGTRVSAPLHPAYAIAAACGALAIAGGVLLKKAKDQ